ncbi:MAG: arginase family protein [Rhodospirillales bacterium]|nr:arginase family protein [Rhodospirillales bacterium]
MKTDMRGEGERSNHGWVGIPTFLRAPYCSDIDTIDADALDVPLVSGCVSAEPNGMSYAELRDCFGAIAARNEIVGFDFVEVNPVLDVGTGVTSYIGAHLVVECLGLVCEQAWWKARVNV